GQRILKNMAVLFGVGFGLFIDEIGKYLTRDNYYWFRPAFIFIYVSFVLIFLFYKYLDRQTKKTDKEVFYSILRNLEEVGENDLEVSEKREMLIKLTELKLTGNKNERTSAMAMERMIKEIRAKSDRKVNNRWQMAKGWLQPMVGKVVSKKLVQISLWLYAIYYSVTRIVDMYLWLTMENKNFDMMALKIIFETVVAILFLLGARWWWSQKRLRALRLFRYGLYVNILLVSVFKFYFEQIGAIYDVVLAMLVMELLGEYKVKKL
nr:hypothetical protein [Candidatus Shapirobacteria bacterium]